MFFASLLCMIYLILILCNGSQIVTPGANTTAQCQNSTCEYACTPLVSCPDTLFYCYNSECTLTCGANACHNITIVVSDSSHFTLICDNYHSCRNAYFNCSDASQCRLQSTATTALLSTDIHSYGQSNSTLLCHTALSCQDISLYCESEQRCQCNQYCDDVTIIAPPPEPTPTPTIAPTIPTSNPTPIPTIAPTNAPTQSDSSSSGRIVLSNHILSIVVVVLLTIIALSCLCGCTYYIYTNQQKKKERSKSKWFTLRSPLINGTAAPPQKSPSVNEPGGKYHKSTIYPNNYRPPSPIEKTPELGIIAQPMPMPLQNPTLDNIESSGSDLFAAPEELAAAAAEEGSEWSAVFDAPVHTSLTSFYSDRTNQWSITSPAQKHGQIVHFPITPSASHSRQLMNKTPTPNPAVIPNLESLPRLLDDVETETETDVMSRKGEPSLRALIDPQKEHAHDSDDDIWGKG